MSTAKTALAWFGLLCATSYTAALLWIGWVSYQTRRQTRRMDQPMRGDDHVMRCVRAQEAEDRRTG